MQWTSLASTIIGGILALGDGLFGTWRSDRRAAERDARARDHERDVWARGLRYEAHVHFLREFESRFNQVSESRMTHPDDEVPDKYLDTAWNLLQDLKLICDQETSELAYAAMSTLRRYVYGADDQLTAEEISEGLWTPVHLARDRYLGAVRREFGLKPIKLLVDD